jgi:hypothetical protein
MLEVFETFSSARYLIGYSCIKQVCFGFYDPDVNASYNYIKKKWGLV